MFSITVKKAQDVRLAVRAAVLCAVAFGLSWSADQVAAVMLATEATLRLFVTDKDA